MTIERFIAVVGALLGLMQAYNEFKNTNISQEVLQCEVAELKRAVYEHIEPEHKCYEIAVHGGR